MRLQFAFVFLSYLVAILLDWYIWNDFRKLSIFSFRAPENKKRGHWSVAFLIYSVLMLAELTVAISLPHNSEEQGLQAIMWLLYIFVTVLFSEIIYFIFSLIGWWPKLKWCLLRMFLKHPQKAGRRYNTGFWIGLPLAIVLFCGMWYGAFFGRRNIEVNEITIESSRIPESFNGYKIAQISDLHVGTWGNDTSFLSKLVDNVNSLKPDLIVFTGDIVNRESGELRPFVNTLSRLHAPDGVLSILGNHDYGDYIHWEKPEDKVRNLNNLKEMQKNMGWQLLNNSHLYLKSQKGDSIAIIGVENWGEPPFTVYGDLKKAFPQENLNNNEFKILLSHNPEHWNQVVSKISNIDLTLSGHTHAMQIMLNVGNWKWSPAAWKYDQWGGIYTRKTRNGENVDIYVNIGAGSVGMPMRLGASPEITLITLQNKK